MYPRVLVRTADGGQKVVAVRPKQFEKHFGVKWARHNRFATPADAEAFTASEGGPHVAAAFTAELDAAERGPRPGPGPRWSSDPALNAHHWPTIKAGRSAPVYIAAVDHPNLPKGQVGVFAERTIRRGELIGLHTGLVTAEKLPDTTYAWSVTGRRATDAAQPSLRRLGLGTTSYRVDGKSERNVLTYVNHAENPNAEGPTTSSTERAGRRSTWPRGTSGRASRS